MFSKLNKFFAGKEIKTHECGIDKEQKAGRKHDHWMTVGMLAVAAATVSPLAIQKYLEMTQENGNAQLKTEILAQPTKTSVLARSFETHSITEKGDTLLTYQFSGDSVSLSRAQKLVDLVLESKTGADVLKHMADNKCVLSLETVNPQAIGFFDPETNAICLNPTFSDALLASTLVHEGKHAQQFYTSGYSRDPKYDKESQITLSRAMEGDAVMTQTTFAFELLADAKPDAWIELRVQKPEVIDAFLDAMIKYNKDPVKVSQETMLAWYKNKEYVRMYEEQYAMGMAYAVQSATPEEAQGMFRESIPADSIASRVCISNGIKYFGTDGSALRDSTTHYIHRDTRDFLDKVDGEFARKTGNTFSVVPGINAKSDPSHQTFYVVENDGSMSAPSIQMTNTGKQDKTLHFFDAVRLIEKQKSLQNQEAKTFAAKENVPNLFIRMAQKENAGK